MEQLKKQQIIGLSAIISALGVYWSLEATGVLDPLFDIKYNDMNAHHIIIHGFFILGIGTIVANFLLGKISMQDTLSSSLEFTQDLTGLSEEESREVLDNLKPHVFAFMKDKEIDIPSPQQLLHELKLRHSTLLSQSSNSVLAISNAEFTERSKLSIIPAKSLEWEGLESMEEYTKGTIKKALILLGAALIVFILTRFFA